MYVVGHGGSDHIVVGFTTNYAINVSHQMQVCRLTWLSCLGPLAYLAIMFRPFGLLGYPA
jgi:hypothetical protein